jgi:aminomethyltransferase
MSDSPAPLLNVPLNDLHIALGARMVPFAGYSACRCNTLRA